MSLDAVNFASVVATLIFGLASVYFYIRSRRVTRLAFTYVDTVLQTKDHPEVIITFRDELIANLSRLRVIVSNNGTEAIRASDVPASAPPTIRFMPSARILSIAASCPGDALEFTARQDSAQTVTIGFKYLNPRDVGAVEVLYDAGNANQSDNQFTFEASIIGGESLRVERYARPTTPWSAAVGGLLLSIIGAVLLVFDLRESFGGTRFMLTLIVDTVFVLAGVFTALAPIRNLWRRPPHKFASEFLE
jgi:hypothetical protein